MGTAAILLCFMLLMARGLRIAVNARRRLRPAAGRRSDDGPSAIQTFIILGGVTRLLPLTGITLPFMSYGGSSLLSNFILIALLDAHLPSTRGRTSTGRDGGDPHRGEALMQRQIVRVGIGLMAVFIAVFIQLNYVQIFAAEEIASNNANIRGLLREYSIKRGDILTHDGVTIATSRRTGGRFKYRRVYPQGELYGHITGFYSIVYGKKGIESTFDDQLLGDSGVLSMQDIEDRLFDSGEEGDDVRLTIESELQETAQSRSGRRARSRRRDRPDLGAGQSDVEQPLVRPVPSGLLRNQDPEGVLGVARPRRQPGDAATQPRHVARLPARFDVQGRYGGRGPRVGQGHTDHTEVPRPGRVGPAADRRHAHELHEHVVPGRSSRSTCTPRSRSRATRPSRSSDFGCSRRSSTWRRRSASTSRSRSTSEPFAACSPTSTKTTFRRAPKRRSDSRMSSRLRSRWRSSPRRSRTTVRCRDPGWSSRSSIHPEMSSGRTTPRHSAKRCRPIPSPTLPT